jgi:hypothetical protein
MIGQNGHFTQRSRDDDFRNRFGNEQTLRGNEIEFETVSHGYSLLFNYAGVTDLSFNNAGESHFGFAVIGRKARGKTTRPPIYNQAASAVSFFAFSMASSIEPTM